MRQQVLVSHFEAVRAQFRMVARAGCRRRALIDGDGGSTGAEGGIGVAAAGSECFCGTAITGLALICSSNCRARRARAAPTRAWAARSRLLRSLFRTRAVQGMLAADSLKDLVGLRLEMIC